MKPLTLIGSRLLGQVCFLLLVPPLCWGQDNAAVTAESLQTQSPQSRSANQLLLDLQQAQALLPSVSDTRTRQQLNTLLANAQAQANDLPQSGPAKPESEKAVSAGQLAQILKGLNSEDFDAGRVFYVQETSKTRCFTSAQVYQLLNAFDFDAGREDAAVALYPHVVDPDNFPRVFNAFDFDQGRNDIQQKLNL